MTIASLRLAAAFCLLLPCAAEAQFTAVIRRPDTTRAARADSVVTAGDTVKPTQLTSLEAWVDSAARALANAPPADSATIAAAQDSATQPAAESSDTGAVAARAETAARAAGARNSARRPTRDSVGAAGTRAPDTASPLPLLIATGLGLVGVGALCLRRRRT